MAPDFSHNKGNRVRFMHLSISSPTHPRSGNGGVRWGFAQIKPQNPHPWGKILLLIPYHTGFNQIFVMTNSPPLGRFLVSNVPPSPTIAQPGVGGCIRKLLFQLRFIHCAMAFLFILHCLSCSFFIR